MNKIHSALKDKYQEIIDLSSDIYFRGTTEFDRLRQNLIWNARMQLARSPDVILRASHVSEVVAVVQFAREHGVCVSLRGSGHDYGGAAIRDGGILIDLGKLDGLEIDATTNRARIGSGLKGGHLIKELAKQNLAFPIGHCADVAASGYILSGGFGWNYGEWGPACANVAAIEMVTADGEILRTSDECHPDLFWAAKGAGSTFFAAVTSYDIILHKLPVATLAVSAVFEASSGPLVANWLNKAGQDAHPTVEIICLVGPDTKTGIPSLTIRMIANSSSLQEARDKLGPLLVPPTSAQLISPLKQQEVDFVDLPQFSSMPSGKRVAADHLWSEAAIGDLLLSVLHLADAPQISSAISITCLGGRARTPHMPNGKSGALSVGGLTSAGIYALWDSEEADRFHLDWVDAATRALAPFCTGRYVGEADLLIEPGRLAQCFSPRTLSRLRELNYHYDSTNVFSSSLAP